MAKTETRAATEPTALPLVTVITPAYERADLVAETIDSVLAQDYPRLEYIVLDDGSRDATLDVVRRYEGRLRWYTHSNMGEARTVNKGLGLARGEIVGVVNSDDPLRPGAVRLMVTALLQHPEAVVAYPDWEMIDERGQVIRTIRTYNYRGRVDMIRRHYCLPGPGAFFRRSLIDALAGRDPELRYVSDLDFWFRAAEYGDLLRVPEVLATFRTHSGSATVAQQGTRMAEEHERVVDKVFSRTDLPEALKSIEREARSSAAFVAGTVCGRKEHRSRLKYFARALRLAPANYVGEWLPRVPLMLSVALGAPYIDVYYVLRRLQSMLPFGATPGRQARDRYR